MVEKLDRIQDVDGKTVLDNTLIVVMSENSTPHSNKGQPMLTIGSAGGAIKTGKMFDYRHSRVACARRGEYAVFAGIPMNCFFNTVLQSFGVPPSHYEKPRSGVYQYGGYGAVASTESPKINEFFKVENPKIYDLKTDPLGRVYQRRNRSGLLEFWKESGRIRLTDQTLPGVMT